MKEPDSQAVLEALTAQLMSTKLSERKKDEINTYILRYADMSFRLLNSRITKYFFEEKFALSATISLFPLCVTEGLKATYISLSHILSP